MMYSRYELKEKDRLEAEREAQIIIRGLKHKLRTAQIKLRNKPNGKLSLRALSKDINRNQQLTNTKIFNRKRKDGRDHNVLILVDFSGSMTREFYGSKSRLLQAKQSLYSLCVVLNELRINYSIYTFSTDNKDGIYTYLNEVKRFGERKTKSEILSSINNVELRAGAVENNDAIALLGATDILVSEGRADNKKLLIMISDGQPIAPIPIDGFSLGSTTLQVYFEEITHEAIDEINKKVKTLAISMSNEANRFLINAPYHQKLFLGEEKSRKNFTKNLIEAYLKAVNGGVK